MADQKLLTVTVTNVNAPLYSGDVVSVSVPGIDGDMTVMGNHEPLISPLKEGEIRLQEPSGNEIVHSIRSGVLEVSHNHATILI